MFTDVTLAAESPQTKQNQGIESLDAVRCCCDA